MIPGFMVKPECSLVKFESWIALAWPAFVGFTVERFGHREVDHGTRLRHPPNFGSPILFRV